MNINKKPWPLATICGPIRARIDTRPDYQRPLVWSRAQKQLLIDTMLRGYDIPKLYWRRVSRNPDQYEVVDGQQRLHAVWDYYDNRYALPLDIDPVNGYKIAGAHYSELPDELRIQLDTYPLDIVVLEETDEDEAREMFLRLQSGTTLKAAEKRNAMPGNLRNLVCTLAKHDFFQVCGFANKRFDFDQVAAQMILLEINHGPLTLTDRELTKAYTDYADFDFEHGQGKRIADKTRRVLDFLKRAFPDKTPELRKAPALSLYWLVSTLMETHAIHGREKEFRKWFIDFEARREAEEQKPQDQQDEDMAIYHDHVIQATNSQDSVEYRHRVLSSMFMLAFPDLPRLDNQREFTEEQRLAIFRKYNGVCQWIGEDGTQCGVKCSWSDWHADHIIPWSKGGPTTVTNGQVLCPKHNLTKGSSLPNSEFPLTAPETFAKPMMAKATTNPREGKNGESPRDASPQASRAGNSDKQNYETGQPYTGVLAKLRRMGWTPEQLSGVGRTGYALNSDGSEIALLRYAKKQKQGQAEYYFFGVTPSIVDRLSTLGNLHVFLECGDSSHVLVFPGSDFRQLMANVPQAGSSSEWKIKIYHSAFQWTLYPSGERVDISKYLNRYPEP